MGCHRLLWNPTLEKSLKETTGSCSASVIFESIGAVLGERVGVIVCVSNVGTRSKICELEGEMFLVQYKD